MSFSGSLILGVAYRVRQILDRAVTVWCRSHTSAGGTIKLCAISAISATVPMVEYTRCYVGGEKHTKAERKEF